MPVATALFVLLFSYVFGSAIHVPGGGNYHQYLLSGMVGMAMAGSAPGTAVGLTTDMSSGLIDRFRSLPMFRAAVLARRPGMICRADRDLRADRRLPLPPQGAEVARSSTAEPPV